jgi:hypothetical protein
MGGHGGLTHRGPDGEPLEPSKDSMELSAIVKSARPTPESVGRALVVAPCP